MGKIVFERIESEVRFHNPLRDFAEDLHRLEIRKDPLLGDVSVYNPYLKDKAKAFFGDNDPALIQKFALFSSTDEIPIEGLPGAEITAPFIRGWFAAHAVGSIAAVETTLARLTACQRFWKTA